MTASQQSDYYVQYVRTVGALRCLQFQALGDLPSRPSFVFAAALLTRLALLASMVAFVVALFHSRAAAVLTAAWLVAKFGLWQAISSLNVVEDAAFGPRGVASVQIVLGLLLVTTGRPVLAAVAFGTGFYTQILNAGLAAVVAAVYLLISVPLQPDRRIALKKLSGFVGVLVLFGLPYVVTTGSALVTNVSLREWTAMRFLVEPDDTSLLYTFRWVGPEWYALHVLGVLAMAFLVRRKGGARGLARAWLAHPAARWFVAVWIVMAAAATCELFYEQLPSFPFVWVLQFQFRQVVWLSGFLMVAAVAAALIPAASPPPSLVRRLGQTSLAVALVLPLVRFYPSALGILLLLTLPAAILSTRVTTPRRRAMACFGMALPLLAAPHVSLWLADMLGMADGPAGMLARTIARTGMTWWGTIALAAFVALAPLLASTLTARRPAMRALALSAYVAWFLGWPGIATGGGWRPGAQLEGFASHNRLSIAEWREFTRRHDWLMRSLMPPGGEAAEARRDLEDAARAAGRLTPDSAVLLVPLDASHMRGQTRRSVLILEDEDSDASMYSPLVWQEFRARFEAVTGWDYLKYKRRERQGTPELPPLRELYLSLTSERIDSLADHHGVTHVLTEADHVLPYPELFRNGRYVLYEINPGEVQTTPLAESDPYQVGRRKWRGRRDSNSRPPA